ncbi:MAG: hypothetical protein HOY69_40330 [Streptomyces sp.]|nr:hypothetical protein [Streptomyces sp.]
MGSLRNPVGPLPSSIYWRRRVAVSVTVALVAALVVWAVTRGSGGGGKDSSAPTGSHTPVGTITAGPTPSGTHISGRPGGRDTSPADTDGGTGSGTSAGDTAGSGDTAGTGDTSGSSAGDTAGSGDGTSAGTSGASGTSGGNGVQVPAGSTLPDCAPGTVSVSLSGDSNQNPAGQTPTFKLTVGNSGGSCKLDVGPGKAVFSVSRTSDPANDHVWASDDCPTGSSSYLLQVPAHGTAVYSLHWAGKSSSPHCASPKGVTATAGNYVAQVSMPGYGVKKWPFTLLPD